MDQTRTPQSELLQSRLRDHKVEVARESKRTAPEHGNNNNTAQVSTPGRDDDIFTDDEQERQARRPNARPIQSSPAAPSSWRYDRDASGSRRPNGQSSSSNNTPRAMGVREMEDHIDKLSKQNFDLKMEVFHRRERAEQLEKKLKDYPQLEDDLNSALDANDELVSALEARDRAVDEAVVMITELEQRNRNLEEQLAEAKAIAARAASQDETPAVPQSPGRRSQKTPRKSRDRRSLQGAVSPDVSARMVELASPSEPRPESARIPSFLQSSEPTTAALRSMYVEGDQVVRPIPSYATLLSNVNSDVNDDRVESGMRSPRLSELSESDLRSIYEQDQPVGLEREVDEPPPPQEHASQQANARVSRWVADRAISPVKPHKTRKSNANDAANGFQSLDHVLTRQPALTPTDAPAKPNSRLPRAPQQEKSGHTPPMPINPIFGQNMFPPTPDTMMTRPSNNSTTSFVQDGNPFEAAHGNAKATSQPAPQSQPRLFVSPQPRKQATTPNRFLPQEFDAYDSPPNESRRGLLNGTQDFGEPLSRGYSSDESYAAEPIRRQYRHNQPSLEGSTAIDADSLRDGAPTLSSPSPPRFFDSRIRLVEMDYPSLGGHKQKGGVVVVAPTENQVPYHNNQATPTNNSFAPRTHTREMSNTSSMQTPRQPPPLPQPLSSGIPMTRREIYVQPPNMTTTSPPNPKSTKSLAARTASIRNRLSRRKTTSSAVEEAATPVASAPTSSAAQRSWFRRSSSEHGPSPLMTRVGRERSGSIAKTSPVTPFWSSERGNAMGNSSHPSIPTSPQRSKSERRQPSISVTSRSNQSYTSFSSMQGRGKPTTPSEYSAAGVDDVSISPEARPRRPSLGGRFGTGGKSVSKSDIPPVPNTPTEYLKWESEPEPPRSRWRFGRSRSSSRTRQEPAWPTTLSGFDGTAAGRRG